MKEKFTDLKVKGYNRMESFEAQMIEAQGHIKGLNDFIDEFVKELGVDEKNKHNPDMILHGLRTLKALVPQVVDA